jgi:hypothetical protein
MQAPWQHKEERLGLIQARTQRNQPPHPQAWFHWMHPHARAAALESGLGVRAAAGASAAARIASGSPFGWATGLAAPRWLQWWIPR